MSGFLYLFSVWKTITALSDASLIKLSAKQETVKTLIRLLGKGQSGLGLTVCSCVRIIFIKPVANVVYGVNLRISEIKNK